MWNLRHIPGSKMELKYFVVILCLLVSLCRPSSAADGYFTDITTKVFKNNSGYLAAFTDFNSDKAIDVFTIAKDARPENGFRSIVLNYASNPKFESEKPFDTKTIFTDVKFAISSLMPGDLNGDKIQDLVVYSKREKKIVVYWGMHDNNGPIIKKENQTVIDNVMVDPLLFDYNGDRAVDIFTSINETTNRHVIVCENRDNVIDCLVKNLEARPQQKYDPIAENHSNSFVDLNGDLVADLLVCTEHGYELWYWSENHSLYGWQGHDKRSYPGNAPVDSVGQSIFVDFNSAGVLHHIVPTADDKASGLYIFNDENQRWESMLSTSTRLHFWKDSAYYNALNMVLSVKSADLDQDGYPDFVAIVNKDNKRKIVAFLNREKTTGVGPIKVMGRQLEVREDLGDLSSFSNVVNFGFFDIHEDGKVDIMLVDGDLGEQNWTVHALQNTHAEDACFIKVITVGGLCSKDACFRLAENTPEYGYNQPGPSVKYTITGPNGNKRESAAAQLYQTAHGALQLPYILFGIGQSPNFVDTLEVKMPGLAEGHTWTQIIPNSQMLVIPNPPKVPPSWQNKLFITPSRKMLDTGIALIGVVIVNLIIIFVLHYMEKRQDRKEKQALQHIFNFDAM